MINDKAMIVPDWHDSTSIPDWQDINCIVSDLREVLDSIDTLDGESVKLRMSIARTIAMMREEKVVEKQVKIARALITKLAHFKLIDAGIIDV